MCKTVTRPLDAGFTLEIDAPFVAPAALLPRIDEIWTNEQSKRGNKLTNGLSYALVACRPDRLTLQAIEYRHVVARRRAPELVQAGLAVRPMAVTGILCCSDGVVLGRRGVAVASDMGLWEPVPSGGLTCADPAMQILQELEEELGLKESALSARPWPCGLVEDEESGVFDIVFMLKTNESGAHVRSVYESCTTREHAEIAVVAPNNLPAFLQTHRECLLPALAPMLEIARLTTGSAVAS